MQVMSRRAVCFTSHPQLSQSALRIRQVMGTYRHIAHDFGWDKVYDNGYLSITGAMISQKTTFRYRVMSLPGQPYERLQDADMRRAFYQAHWKNILWVGGRSDGYLGDFCRTRNNPMQGYRLQFFELRSTESIRELEHGPCGQG